jgi:peptidoglycan/xylan/chitin deacetylase (PgdA/CDA1 family)
MVFDRTAAQVVFEETVAGTAHTAQLPAERCSHDLMMRTRAMRDGAWGEWTEFSPLPLELVLGERRDSPPPLALEKDPGLLLLFTVDTECSVLRQPNPDPDRVVDELIFGDFGNGRRPGGIGLQMDLLEHFGFRGCFFVDVLMEFEHGQRALERTIEAIAERGHEVELHVHPEHLVWSSDPPVAKLSGDLSGGRGGREPDVFRRLMQLSVDLFERRVGRRPLAYRAGAYRIADMHFAVLEEFGIRIDSSVQPYFNSNVSDWMRTRTQPFWVGGVLEVPPTLLMLNDNPDAWQTRGFAPSSNLGESVSSLPAEAGGPPRVATFVSHSFQLLRCRESREKDAIEAFAERMRSGLPLDMAERLLSWAPGLMRTFGEEVDEELVVPVAGLLRRIADRPDARCVTYADLAGAAERFWPTERHPPVDPIPLMDRPRGVAGMARTRIFGRDLLEHLREEGAAASAHGDGDPAYVDGLERCAASELRDRIDSLVAQQGSGEPARLRLRTLGVAAPGRRGGLPPLAELLFPQSALRGVGDEGRPGAADALPWDVPTFEAWLEESGYEFVSRRRLPRRSEDVAAIARFAEKLAWLDPFELRTEALEVELRPGRAGGSLQSSGESLAEWVDDAPVATVTFPSRIDPGLLPDAASELYESLRPGHELLLRMVDNPAPASRTTVLLALMRAGLEILDRERFGYRLVRPIELADIKRFAGVA